MIDDAVADFTAWVTDDGAEEDRVRTRPAIEVVTWPDAERCAFLVEPRRKGEEPYRCGGAPWAHEGGSHAFVAPGSP